MLSCGKSSSILIILYCLTEWYSVQGSILGSSKNLRRSSCTSEIESANKTIGNWAITMRQMLNADDKPNLRSELVTREENRIQDLIMSFSANMNKKPIEQLVKDLVSIRRRSNRMALDIYLRTFDMRWPQTSVQLGVAVERVQEACLSNLDRTAMLVLGSPSSFNGSSSVQNNKNRLTA